MKKIAKALILKAVQFCYVCNRKIKSGQGIYVGQGRHRHYRCAPGTSIWLRSEQGLKSEHREIWLKNSVNKEINKEINKVAEHKSQQKLF